MPTEALDTTPFEKIKLEATNTIVKLCAVVSRTWLSIYFLQADDERRLLQLCYKGCTADISQFRELLRQGVDVNSYDEVGITVVRPAQYNTMQN